MIFAHKDFPDAGLQVPAGTIEKGESQKNALLREVEEESGLTNFNSIRLLGNQLYIASSKSEIHDRNFYQLTYSGECPPEFEHTVKGIGEDRHLLFLFKWVKLENIPALIAEHDHFFSEITV